MEEELRTAMAPLAVIYEGTAVDAGQMDVRDLAPALLGIATLFEAPPFEDVLAESRYWRAFTVMRLDFKEGRKWRLSDGEREYAVEIEDDEFLQRVDRGEERFGKGDMLICDVATRQVVSKGRLRTEIVVERVIEHRPPAEQLRLPFSSGDEPEGDTGPEGGDTRRG